MCKINWQYDHTMMCRSKDITFQAFKIWLFFINVMLHFTLSCFSQVNFTNSFYQFCEVSWGFQKDIVPMRTYSLQLLKLLWAYIVLIVITIKYCLLPCLNLMNSLSQSAYVFDQFMIGNLLFLWYTSVLYQLWNNLGGGSVTIYANTL